MFVFRYRPQSVCANEMEIAIEDDVIESVKIFGGCPGSGMGVSLLVQGMNINEALSKLKGIPCGPRSTSCPDQLAYALELYLEQKPE